MFAKILVVSLIKMFVSSIQNNKKINNFVVYHCKPENVGVQKTWESV